VRRCRQPVVLGRCPAQSSFVLRRGDSSAASFRIANVVICKSDSHLCNIAWDIAFRTLHFVRRGVNYCNAVVIPLPSLGVSSLDLGRLLYASGPFFALVQGNRYSAAAR
jgi:hypothetical protein